MIMKTKAQYINKLKSILKDVQKDIDKEEDV